MKVVSYIAYILICSAIVFVSVRFTIGASFFPMHDDTQPGRVFEMAKVLKQGQIPPRWVPDLGYGYGYPIFQFYAPLPYIVGAVTHIVGVPLVSATNVMMFVGMALGFVTSLVLGVYLFGWVGGLVFATIYQYSPYHAIQLYVRGAVGEIYAYGFLPLIVYGVWRSARREKTRTTGIMWTVVGVSGMILSHTIYGYLSVGALVVLVVAFLLYGMIARCKEIHTISISLLVSIALSLAMTSFFWLPAIAEKSATNVTKVVGIDSAELTDHFVCPSQFWQSPWGFGGSAKGCAEDGMSFKLGKLQIFGGILASLLYAWHLYTQKNASKKQAHMSDTYRAPLLIGVIFTVCSLFFMLSVSAAVWNLIPMSSFVQYPWRLLPVTALGLAFLCGVLVAMVPKRGVQYVVAAVFCITVVYQGVFMFTPKYTYVPKDGIFSTESDLKWRVSKISDEYMPPGFIAPQYETDISRAIITSVSPFTVDSIRDKNTKSTICVTMPATATVVIHKATFPGWRYWVDGKETKSTIIAGLPQIVVPEGSHCIELVLTRTMVRLIGDVVSLLALIGGATYVITKKANT